jgi:hypothetical protein
MWKKWPGSYCCVVSGGFVLVAWSQATSVKEPKWLVDVSKGTGAGVGGRGGRDVHSAFYDQLTFTRGITPSGGAKRVVLGHAVGDHVAFEDILKYDVLAGGPFEVFLEREIANLRLHPIMLTYYMFWSDADQFQRTPSPDVRILKLLSRVIHANYIAPDAPYDLGSVALSYHPVTVHTAHCDALWNVLWNVLSLPRALASRLLRHAAVPLHSACLLVFPTPLFLLSLPSSSFPSVSFVSLLYSFLLGRFGKFWRLPTLLISSQWPIAGSVLQHAPAL